jgi:hypothetical protein
MNSELQDQDELERRLSLWAENASPLNTSELRVTVQLRRNRLRARQRNIGVLSVVVIAIACGWIAFDLAGREPDRVANKITPEPQVTPSQSFGPNGNVVESDSIQRELVRLSQKIQIAQMQFELAMQREALNELNQSVSEVSFSMARSDTRNSLAYEWSIKHFAATDSSE